MTRGRECDLLLAPRQQGHPAAEAPENQDPLLVAARWTHRGEESPEDADVGED